MAIVDRYGLPLAVTAHAANHHELTLAQLTFDFHMIEAKPENLIGDRAYDSDRRDEQMRAQGTLSRADRTHAYSRPRSLRSLPQGWEAA